MRLNITKKTLIDIIKNDIQVLFVVLIVMFVVSYLLAIYFSRTFTSPILQLVKFLETIVNVDLLKERIYTDEQNEFGKLYYEVNTMLDRIEESHKALKIASVAFETQSGMAITNKEGIILKVNQAFCDITGYRALEVLGERPSILRSGVHDSGFYQKMFDSVAKYNYWSGEINNRHKSGRIVHEYLTIQSVLDEQGEIEYYVSSFIDITLQKEIERKLKESEALLVQQSKMAAMGEMLENIAHQWKQPLSIISTSATGIKAEKEFGISTEERELERIEAIKNSTEYLSQTIDDFRNFFKQDKEKTKFILKSAYSKTLDIVKSKFKNRNIEIVENCSDIEAFGFENELKQVIMNILNNACDELEKIKEQEHKRIIMVDIFQNMQYSVLKIKDSANGIPSTIINRVFEPYFTTKSESGGTGIGLYMSYEMVTNHMDGKLEVYNEEYEYKGKSYKGACFTISLPLAQ
jgi:two-component system sensor histidine kinase AtoS